MKEWWNRKTARRRKRIKGKYTFVDFIWDVLFWVPELILFPFRLLFWFFRALVKSIWDLFDIV